MLLGPKWKPACVAAHEIAAADSVAESDLATARDWYEQKSEGLSHAFLDEVAGAFQELIRHPELPRLYSLNFRRILLHRFLYKIRLPASALVFSGV